VLQKVAEESQDRDIGRALEVIAGLEMLVAALQRARLTGIVDNVEALTRLEKAGYGR
jgi:hypothetical protein